MISAATTLPSVSRIRVKSALVIAITFLVGMAAGVASDRLLHTPLRADFRSGGPFRAFAELGLSPAQCAAIDSVFQRGRPRMAVALASIESRMRAVTDSIRAEIQQILTPEQRARFEQTGRPTSAFGPGGRRDGLVGPPRPPGLCR